MAAEYTPSQKQRYSVALQHARTRRNPRQLLGAMFQWPFQILVSTLIISVMLFIVVNFYLLSSVVAVENTLYVFILISVLTDGLYLFLHIPRRRPRYRNMFFDPDKMTILICCYNGADVIEETIDNALVHVPPEQIVVVSDASTDNTVSLAHSKGVRVIENERNLNKAFSVSRAVHELHTPYVLLLDDDTLIGKTFIPTSLLDDGYSAVAFNVMPVPEDTFVNALQMFEYRKSRDSGKELRARAGAVGNVSGAIGLFRTDNLQAQAYVHSGQFSGEDEQRTVLTHLYSGGKGVTYTDSTVLTKVPANWRALMRQRSFSWNVAIPEQFVLFWRVLLHPKQHYMLKLEKAYQIYLFLTDPLRLLFFWVLVVRVNNLLLVYTFYFVLSFVIWVRTRGKDPFWVVIVSPFYNLLLTACRLISHAYWVKIKINYIFKRKFHREVRSRFVLGEYAAIMVVLVVVWGAAIQHFVSDMELLKHINANKLEEFQPKNFQYDNVSEIQAQQTTRVR